MPISKIDAAGRQLNAAIDFFFRQGDPIAVATLAYNALEISATLARLRGEEDWTQFKEVAVLHGTTTKEVRDVFHAPRDFFKHADRYPDEVLASYDTKDAMYLLALTVLQFGEVAERSVEMWSALIWFYAVQPEFQAPEALRNLVDEFAYIRKLDRPAQLAVRAQVLEELRKRARE